MKAPFPYFGGKAKVASIIWDALGDCAHYIEPFFGSGAVLLLRPDWHKRKMETVNDKDGFIANVWRALQSDPDEVARWCDWPVNHADLMARRKVLLANEERLLDNLVADADWYDSKLAGYWIWAASCWIGSGLTRPGAMPLVGHAGEGINASTLREQSTIQGHYNEYIYTWFRELSERLRYVRVVCGDWSRVCVGNWQDVAGVCGIFFDPPYAVDDRDKGIYHVESLKVAHDVRAWALERGDRETYRIVIAGYDEHEEELDAAGWLSMQWKAGGGYGNQGHGQGKANRHREMLYFSPHCLGREEQLKLFD